MNPFFRTKASDDPVVKQLARLGIPTPITPPYVKLRGQQSPLSETERQQIAQLEGQDFYGRVTKLIRSSTWPGFSDEKKRERMSDLRRVVSDGRAQRLLKIREVANPIRGEIAGRLLRGNAD